MLTVVGVSFRTATRIYTFDPAGRDLAPGQQVVVDTARGEDLGVVKYGPREVEESLVVQPLKQVLREANAADLQRAAENESLAESALALARERVAARSLPMRFLRGEYAFNRAMVTLYFVADGRVDFRELVRDLAAKLRLRIQLHQVGARDAAKLVGGIGPCGRTLCCASWLTEFDQISMRMAKEQSLFLNPTKYSGVCGKLMCCLRYEWDLYRETRAELPQPGGRVLTADGAGRVESHNVLKQTVVVALESGAHREYPAADVERAPVEGCSVLAGGACRGGCSG